MQREVKLEFAQNDVELGRQLVVPRLVLRAAPAQPPDNPRIGGEIVPSPVDIVGEDVLEQFGPDRGILGPRAEKPRGQWILRACLVRGRSFGRLERGPAVSFDTGSPVRKGFAAE